jgi:hypothetical protein
MKRSLIAAGLLCLAGPAFGQVVTFDSQTASTPAPVTGPDDKVICEKITRTGSRLEVEKVCLTALQWRDHKAGQRNDLEKWQERSNQEPSDPQGGFTPPPR